VGIILLLCLLLSSFTAVAETEVKWTPAAESSDAGENSGPLPLSNNQRQQLLQLADTIRNSPNPQATLEQAAAANNMPPEQLLNMLERNYAEMQQAAGGGMMGRPHRTKQLWNLLTSLTVLTARSATKHPRTFTLTALSVVAVLYVAWSAPRTGLVLSSSRNLLSSGPTTVFSPPTPYVERLLEQQLARKPDPSVSLWDSWKELMQTVDLDDLGGDGTTWHDVKKNKQLKLAVTAQRTLPMSDFAEVSARRKRMEEAEEESEEKNEEEEAALLEDALDISLEHAFGLLASRDLTEFAPNVRLVTVHTTKSRKRKHCILIVPGLGDWGRYALLPLQVTQHTEQDGSARLSLTTLQGSHWDGQIHASVEAADDKESAAPDLVVRVHLVVPRKGRKPSRDVASRIVEGISHSLAVSIRNRTRQSLARRSQSVAVSGQAHRRATDRRRSRSEKERKIEEMAADRRRRWQRQNPNAGSYRPSGERMRSPKNAVWQ
jgi:hypothetical protein